MKKWQAFLGSCFRQGKDWADIFLKINITSLPPFRVILNGQSYEWVIARIQSHTAVEPGVLHHHEECPLKECAFPILNHQPLIYLIGWSLVLVLGQRAYPHVAPPPVCLLPWRKICVAFRQCINAPILPHPLLAQYAKNGHAVSNKVGKLGGSAEIGYLSPYTHA